jgi:hypothetical protein
MTSENNINFNTKMDSQVPSYAIQENQARAALKAIDPILPSYSFFIGRTKDGRIIYFPQSYSIGFKNFLDENPWSLRLDLFTIGQLSNGMWVFLPSYVEGYNDAKNELKLALLAAGQRRLLDENKIINNELERQKKLYQDIVSDNENIKDTVVKLEKLSNDLVRENKRMSKEVEEQKYSAETYKKEKEEIHNQLKEIQERISEKEREKEENKKIEKKKGSASPIH